MPCPTNGRTLRGVGVATHDKASTPRLPQREAERAKGQNPRGDHASNKAGFCNTFEEEADHICSERAFQLLTGADAAQIPQRTFAQRNIQSAVPPTLMAHDASRVQTTS